MKRSSNQLPDAAVLRQICFAAVVFLGNAWDTRLLQWTSRGKWRLVKSLQALHTGSGDVRSALAIQETLVQEKHQTQAQFYHQR